MRELSYTVKARVPGASADYYVNYQQALAELDPGHVLTISEKRLERPGSWLTRWVMIGQIWL